MLIENREMVEKIYQEVKVLEKILLEGMVVENWKTAEMILWKVMVVEYY